MYNLPIDPILYVMLNLHCFIGGIAAVIARRKGYNLGWWLVLGLVGGTAALVVALFLKPQTVGEK